MLKVEHALGKIAEEGAVPVREKIVILSRKTYVTRQDGADNVINMELRSCELEILSWPHEVILLKTV